METLEGNLATVARRLPRPRREDWERMAVLHLVHRGGHGIRHAARVLRLPKSTVHGWVRQGPGGIRDDRLRSIAQRAVDEAAPLSASEEAVIAAAVRRALPPGESFAEGSPSGCMAAFFLPADVAERLALDPDDEPTALPPGELHLTLAYLGPWRDVPDPAHLRRVIAGFAAVAPPVPAVVSGIGRFSTGERTVYASVDAPSLPAWRQRLVEHLRAGGYEPSATHGFTPHVSLCAPDGPVTLDVDPLEFEAGTLTLAYGAARYDFPLEGTSVLLAESGRPEPDPKREAELQDGEERAQDAGAATARNTRTVEGPGEPVPPAAAGADVADLIDPALLEPAIMDARALEAWHRYITAVANDVPHSNALHAATRIDPDFEISDAQAKRLIHALGKGQEPVRFGWAAGSARPPPHVTSVYDDFQLDAAQRQELGEYLNQLAVESYLEGVNAQLVEIGRPIVTELTDPDVLANLREQTAAVAEGVAETYDRDLAHEVYTTWIEHRSLYGRQSSRRLLWEDVSRWAEARADDRADMVSTTEVGRFFNLGVLGFLRGNPMLMARVARVYAMPDECECDRCMAIVGDNPYTPDEAMTLPIPAHPRCRHQLSVEWETVSVSDITDFWTGQAVGEVDAEAV